MIEYTLEQKEIIENIQNFNIIVDSVAGSGKTSTIKAICEKYNPTFFKSINMNLKKPAKAGRFQRFRYA
jgi:polyphosphate kinase 2 (PPK2 family)